MVILGPFGDYRGSDHPERHPMSTQQCYPTAWADASTPQIEIPFFKTTSGLVCQSC